MSIIRTLHTEADRTRRAYRNGRVGLPEFTSAHLAFTGCGEAIRRRLPFPTSVAYAYSPRETASSRGGDHLVCEEPVTQGRFQRARGATLCGRSFWGLETQPEGKQASCVRCLEIAERWVKE